MYKQSYGDYTNLIGWFAKEFSMILAPTGMFRTIVTVQYSTRGPCEMRMVKRCSPEPITGKWGTL